MDFLPQYRLRSLYQQYLELDENAFYDKVRFFEQNVSDIRLLEVKKALSIEFEYLEALFSVGHYKTYIDASQEFLQIMIDNNLDYIKDKNAYHEVVYHRALSMYLTKSYDESKFIAKQLLAMNVRPKDTKRLLFYIEKHNQSKPRTILKAAMITLLISSAILLITAQVVVISFYPEFANAFLNGIAIAILPGFFVIGVAHMYMQFTAWSRVQGMEDEKIEKE